MKRQCISVSPRCITAEVIGAKVAASALWDWLKERLKTRSPAAAEAVAEVEHSPGQPANWEVLRAQLAKALAEYESFRKELAERLAQCAPSTNINQQAVGTGVGHTNIQVGGSGNSINVQR